MSGTVRPPEVLAVVAESGRMAVWGLPGAQPHTFHGDELADSYSTLLNLVHEHATLIEGQVWLAARTPDGLWHMAIDPEGRTVPIPDEAFTAPWLGAYFPATLVERFPDLLERHPLRREIIATGLANELVNRGGLTYALRATEESGATLPEVARAFAAARDVFDLPGLWARIEGHEGQVPAAALNALRMDVERLLDRATRWFLQYRGGRLDVLGEVRRMAGPVRALSGSIPSMLIGVERERLDRRARELVSVGAPPALAGEVAALLDVFCLLDVVEVARRNAADPEDVARLYFTISERFEVDRYLVRITALPRDDRWSALARAALRSDLYGALAALTHRVIRATPDDGSPIERVLTWERRNAEGLRRARATLTEVGQAETFDLVTLSVALRVIRTLALGR